MRRILDALRVVAILAALLFFSSLGYCIMSETIDANSYTDDPPNAFQWKAGWECTCDVWLNHYLTPFS